MSFLRNMRLGTQLGLSFAAMILISLLVALYGRVHLTDVASNVSQLADERLESLLILQNLRDLVNENARVVRNMAMQSDRSRIPGQKKLMDKNRKQAMTIQDDLRERYPTPDGKALLAELASATTGYRAAFDKAVDLASADQIDAAREAIQGALRTEQDRYFKAIDKLVAMERDHSRAIALEAKRDSLDASNAMLMLAALAAAIGVLVAWSITRRVKGQLGGEPAYAAEIAQQVAQGQLAMRIDLRPGDTTSVMAAMESMRRSLSGVVSQVRQSSESIATGARQIAMGNADLSQRTEEQASNLQQTAASMEEIGSTINQNAETVRTATQMANAASQTAARGGDVVSNVVSTMQEITTSSRRIGDIIGVIDGIAFQTNILALNAAVEAARAGEQGRGFAVVAGEVRSLAQRSAEAAKDIKTLIGDSVAKVDQGSQQVAQAGRTMETVVDSIRRVADIMGEISAATVEQSSGIEQVSQAVGQMDQVTQQNAALVEEAAAAASSLKSQAAMLSELVALFKLRDGGRAAAYRPQAVPAAAPAAVPAPARFPSKAPAVAAKPAARPAAAPALPGRAAAPAAPKPAPAPAPSARKAAGGDDDWETF